MAQGQPGQGCPVRPSSRPASCRKASTRPSTTSRPPSKSARTSPPVAPPAPLLNAIAAVMPELWGGSADLGGSNKTDLKGAATFAPAECATKQWPNCSKFGRQLHFGVREFTMGTHHQRHPAGLPHPSVRRHLLHVLRLRAFRRASGRPHADSEPVRVVPRLRRSRRRWPDPPAGGAPGFLPRHPAARGRSSGRRLTRPPKPTVTSSRRRTPCRPLWF